MFGRLLGLPLFMTLPLMSVAQSAPLTVYLGSSTYPCTAAGVGYALAVIPNGGAIDATNCTGMLTPGGQVVLNVSNVTFIMGHQTWNFASGTSPSINVTGNNVVIQCKQNQSITTSADIGAVGSDKSVIKLSGNQDEVRNCQIQGQATAAANNSQIGILVAGNNAKITGNLFAGTDASHGLDYGVDSSGASGTDTEQNIFQNMMSKSDATGSGILVTGGGPGVIAHNHILYTSSTANGAHQIYISQNAVEWAVHHNIIESGGSGMIKLYATNAQSPCQLNDVHDNILLNGGNVSGAIGAITIDSNCQHNKIHDNIIKNYARGPGVEITQSGTIHSPDFNQVSNNHFSSIGTYCVEVAGGNNTLIQANDCRNNSTLSAGAYDGILIEGNVSTSNGTQVVWNYVTNTGGSAQFHAGLQISANSPVATGTVISGNSFDIGSFGSAIVDNGVSSQTGLNVLGGAPSFAGSFRLPALGVP